MLKNTMPSYVTTKERIAKNILDQLFREFGVQIVMRIAFECMLKPGVRFYYESYPYDDRNEFCYRLDFQLDGRAGIVKHRWMPIGMTKKALLKSMVGFLNTRHGDEFFMDMLSLPEIYTQLDKYGYNWFTITDRIRDERL